MTRKQVILCNYEQVSAACRLLVSLIARAAEDAEDLVDDLSLVLAVMRKCEKALYEQTGESR